MENSLKTASRPELIQISEEEIGIINDIRRIDFGKVSVSIQNGVIINKEVTIITKTNKHKNRDFTGSCNYPDGLA